MVFEPLISTLSFLTIIPTSKYGFDLRVIARNMYFFPICGAVIGLVVGIIGFSASTFLPEYIASFIILVKFVLITGIHHIDGLADFSDGVMVKGDRDSKRRAMSDPVVGSALAGFSSLFTIEMKKLSKIITSIILTVVLVFLLQVIVGLLTLGIVIIIGLIIYYVAYRNFGGVSGDVFGASNEISRLASLMILSTITI